MARLQYQGLGMLIAIQLGLMSLIWILVFYTKTERDTPAEIDNEIRLDTKRTPNELRHRETNVFGQTQCERYFGDFG